MMDGTNLNVLQTSRQMLRAFGGLNEGYGCSEAEFSGEMNFSSRGYPALQTRKMRIYEKELNGGPKMTLHIMWKTTAEILFWTEA